jgi:hypothetical protein
MGIGVILGLRIYLDIFNIVTPQTKKWTRSASRVWDTRHNPDFTLYFVCEIYIMPGVPCMSRIAGNGHS